MKSALDLGTYRISSGELVHVSYDARGRLVAQREGPNGLEPLDPSVVTSGVKISDDPFWPDAERVEQTVLWKDLA